MSTGAVEREAKLREQANDLYRAIGRFVVKFELMRHNLEIGILFLLEQAGLRNQRAAHILLSGQTAEPLKTWLFSLIGELKKPDEKEASLLKKVGERIQKLTEIRNDVVHCTWFIGWASTEQTDFSEAPGLSSTSPIRERNINSFGTKQRTSRSSQQKQLRWRTSFSR